MSNKAYLIRARQWNACSYLVASSSTNSLAKMNGAIFWSDCSQLEYGS